MVKIPVDYTQFAFKVPLDKLFHFTLLEHVVVSMEYSCLLFFILEGSVDKRSLVLLAFLLFLIAVLQIPLHKHILLLELLVLLLVSPDVDQHFATFAEDSVEL